MRILTKTILLFLTVMIVSVVLISCHLTKGSISNKVENFDKFYSRFHTDSLFQISRIRYPLGGKYVDGSKQTKWSKDNWTMMKSNIYEIDTTQFKVSYQKNEKSFIEKVWIEDSGFSFECKFELIDKKWFLVYALDQNL